MSMKRWNITLPDDVTKELKKIPNKSRFIAEALRQKLNAGKRAKFESLLEEGYRAEAKEARQINKEWESVTLENWPEYDFEWPENP